jgi:RNA polymerase sigma-70 factor (ECF subfamily)
MAGQPYGQKQVVSPVELSDTLSPAEEQILITKAKNNDIAAFEQLIGRHQRTVYNFALYLTNDRDRAEDIAQEALLNVFRSLKDFRGDSPFTTWLFRIVRNVFIDELRRGHEKYKDKRVSLDDQSHSSRTVEDTTDDQLVRNALQEALKRLPPAMRIPLIMYELQGFSYQEISTIEKVSLASIKARIFKARKTLLKDQGLRECWAELQ